MTRPGFLAAALLLAATPASCSRGRAAGAPPDGPAGAPAVPAEADSAAGIGRQAGTPDPGGGESVVDRTIEPPSGLPGEEATRPEPVAFATPDGVEIAASYWRAGDPAAPTVVFVHQARSDRNEWDPFVRELRAKAPGIAILAIDLRGHGESGRAGDAAIQWRNFRTGDAQGLQRWSGCTTDVQSAIAYLRGRGEGTVPRAIGLVGASIGSTSALRAAASDGVEGPGRVAALVLLSPGMAYFGVPIRSALEALKVRSFPVLAVAARDDSNDTVGAIAEIQGLMGDLLALQIYDEGGHGVSIARTHGEVVELVTDYVKSKLGG